MRILIAPTAFKGSYSPLEVARAMKDGVEQYAVEYGDDISVDLLPLADGGDGTVDSIYAACGGELIRETVPGAFGEERLASWVLKDRSAIVEMASASGISGFRKEQLRPLAAHSRGLGVVILSAVNCGRADTIVITLGGSASTDGGAGALAELGAKFYDEQKMPFHVAGGASLVKIASCDLSQCQLLAQRCRFIIATDVENVLLGPLGAATVFGPQKGCSQSDVELLDLSLGHWAELLESAGNNKDARFRPGSGAAGGTAFGLAIALNARIVSGFDYLSDMLGLRERVERADLIFAGEGRIDGSTLSGKAVGSLQNLAKQYGKPLWAFSAAPVCLDDNLQRSAFDNLVSISQAGEQADCMKIARAVFQELEKYYSSANKSA